MRKRVKKHLPNAITCANLFSGCVGIVFAFSGNLIMAAYCIFLAAIFDFFDGFASRVLQSFSGIGKDLDSLADMVSFGFLPSAILYELLLSAPAIYNIGDYICFLAFGIAVFSALRLAKFNTDTRQAEIFIGLPTPANAILIASLPFVAQQYPQFDHIIINRITLIILDAVMCFLLVAELPLMSLKFKANDPRNLYRYLLLLFSAILILFFKFAAVPVVIFIYIVLSIIQLKFQNDKVPG